MSDIQFLRIDAKWSLAYDDRQWVLRRYKGIDKRDGSEVWEGVSFVACSRQVLARCMREKGVPAEAAKPVLDMLPDTFPEFRNQMRGSGSTLAVGTRAELLEAPECHPEPEALENAVASLLPEAA